MQIKTLVSEGAFAGALPEVLAVLLGQHVLVRLDQLLLLLLGLHPVGAGTDEVGDDPALGAGAHRFVLVVAVRPPSTDALEAEDVVALGQDAEFSAARLRLHVLQADAALLVHWDSRWIRWGCGWGGAC